MLPSQSSMIEPGSLHTQHRLRTLSLTHGLSHHAQQVLSGTDTINWPHMHNSCGELTTPSMINSIIQQRRRAECPTSFVLREHAPASYLRRLSSSVRMATAAPTSLNFFSAASRSSAGTLSGWKRSAARLYAWPGNVSPNF